LTRNALIAFDDFSNGGDGTSSYGGSSAGSGSKSGGSKSGAGSSASGGSGASSTVGRCRLKVSKPGV
jgi:hypothetical protein